MMATNPVRQSLLFASLLPIYSAAQLDRWRWLASRTSPLDFGSCPDPGITYDFDLDGSEQLGFAPADQTQFPHGFSSDVSTLEIYICNRLQSVCNASEAAIQACQNAFQLYSGLSGQNAADGWNEALGLYGSIPTQTQSDYGTTTTAVATVLVSGTSVPYSTLFSAVSTVYSESLSSSVLSSYTLPTYTIFSTQTILLDPSSTVQDSASPTTTSTSTVVLSAAISSTSSESISTSIIVPTGGTTITTITSYASIATDPPQSTITGSGDGGGSPFSGKARVLEPLRPVFAACFVVPAFLILFD